MFYRKGPLINAEISNNYIGRKALKTGFAPSIVSENIFVNMGEMGNLYLTFELKNDRLGNN